MAYTKNVLVCSRLKRFKDNEVYLAKDTEQDLWCLFEVAKSKSEKIGNRLSGETLTLEYSNAMGSTSSKPVELVSKFNDARRKQLEVIEVDRLKKTRIPHIEVARENWKPLRVKGISNSDKYTLFSAYGDKIFDMATNNKGDLVMNARAFGYSLPSVFALTSNAKKINLSIEAKGLMKKAGWNEKQVKDAGMHYGLNLGVIAAIEPYALLAGAFKSGTFHKIDDDIRNVGLVDRLASHSRHQDLVRQWGGEFSNERMASSRSYYILSMICSEMNSRGHTAFKLADVVSRYADINNGLDYSEAESVVKKKIEDGLFKSIDAGRDGYFISHARNYGVEDLIYDEIVKRLDVPYKPVMASSLLFEDYYTDEQRQAIKIAVERPLALVTGGAGTGKTTTVKGILTNLSRIYGRDSQVLLAAPTGRAAQRMTEQTGIEAVTIHSLLKYNPDKGFMEAQIPDDVSAIIIDESSMIDSALFYKILIACPPDVRIILTGDIQQLVPVQPGQPFKDLLLSELLPCVTLSQPQRTGAKSNIYMNANRVIKGVKPVLTGDMDDFLFVPTKSDAETMREIERILTEDLITVYGISPDRVQVLSPMRQPKGEVGITGVNRSLQSLLNPNFKGREEICVSDKVIFTRNNYQLKLYNGDVGTVKSLEEGKCIIDVAGKEHVIDEDQQRFLDLAYGLSVHKTQGSEYDLVIMPLSKRHAFMLNPEMLYTAITRAKKHFIFVGDEEVINTALKNTMANHRNTYLRSKLIGEKMNRERKMNGLPEATVSPKQDESRQKAPKVSNHSDLSSVKSSTQLKADGDDKREPDFEPPAIDTNSGMPPDLSDMMGNEQEDDSYHDMGDYDFNQLSSSKPTIDTSTTEEVCKESIQDSSKVDQVQPKQVIKREMEEDFDWDFNM